MKTTLILFGSLLWLAGCAHNKAKQDTSVLPSGAGSAAAAAAPGGVSGAAAAGTTCSDDLQCPEKHLCIDSHCVAIHPGLAECAMARVHFDFGDATLKPAEYVPMARMARCLKADHAMKLDVIGNADERGTEDYNLALGDKRARAVAQYLESLGVSEGQLRTVSYGKERPLCTEHNEDCWQQNRRAGLAPK